MNIRSMKDYLFQTDDPMTEFLKTRPEDLADHVALMPFLIYNVMVKLGDEEGEVAILKDTYDCLYARAFQDCKENPPPSQSKVSDETAKQTALATLAVRAAKADWQRCRQSLLRTKAYVRALECKEKLLPGLQGSVNKTTPQTRGEE